MKIGEEKTQKIKDNGAGRTMRLHSIPFNNPTLEQRNSVRVRKRNLSSFSAIFKTGKMDVDEQINFADHARQVLLPGEDQIRFGPPGKLPELTAQYEAEEQLIASGGMSGIRTACDKSLRRIIALKTLKSDADVTVNDRENFIHEAQLTSQLDHPYIIPIYSLSTDAENRLHMGMKMVNGMTLKERLAQIIQLYQKKGIRNFDEHRSLIFRLNMFLNICNAIAYAHSKKILHGDLKPENIMIGEYHQTYVMDWGIARRIKPNGQAEIIDPSGTISGTPKYISPEAVSAKDLDVRADIFSLGLILFELVTLNFGTVGTESTEIMLNTRNGILNPVKHRFGIKIDKDLEAIVNKAIQPDRDKRYSTVEAFADDLRNYLAGNEVSANPDHFGGRILRLLRAHAMFASIFALFLILLAAAAMSIAAASKLSHAEEKRLHEKSLAFASNGMAYTGSCFDKAAMSYENDVKLIASSIAFLSHSKIPFPNRKIYFANEDHGIRPPGLKVMKSYKRPVTMECFTCVYPGESLSPEIRKNLPFLPPLFDELKRNLLKDRSYGLKSHDNVKKISPLIWVTIGFEDGLLLTYPGFHGMKKGYDVRLRPWYTYSIRRSGTQWRTSYPDAASEGLLMSCTRRILDYDGIPLGVVSLDISVPELAKQFNLSGNPKDFILEKMLLDLDGGILIGKANERFYHIENIMGNNVLQLKKFDPLIFQLIRNQEYGTILLKENGRRILYLFMKLHTFPGYYVEKADYRNLRKFF